uniref:Uncharacterized protein n=2 Tax=Meloidogyne TaxID=189290 RepID=A0A915MVF7_MELJA
MNVAVAKPKERQFQVVPVPAVFTRGRWECIDYKDGASAGAGPVSFSIGGDNQTIEFDKSSASQTPLATQTNVHVGEGVGAGQQQIGAQHQNIQNPVVAVEQRETTPAPQPGIVHQGSTTILPNNATTTNPPPQQQLSQFDISPSHSVPATLGTQNSSTASISAAVTTGGPNAVAIDNKIEQAMDLVKTHLTFAVREEVEILRSTIMDLENKVVPVPAVFTRGRWECIDYKDGASAGTGPVSFSIGGDNQTIEFDKSSASQTPLATQTNVHVGEGVGAGQQQIGAQHQNIQNPVVAVEQRETTPAPQPGIVHQGSTTILPNNATTTNPPPQQLSQFDISPSHSVPATLGTQNSSTASISAAVTTGGPNAVAIDNKIEQAMDLVKTHLTFAVREEVEILRSTIMDLENKEMVGD